MDAIAADRRASPRIGAVDCLVRIADRVARSPGEARHPRLMNVVSPDDVFASGFALHEDAARGRVDLAIQNRASNRPFRHAHGGRSVMPHLEAADDDMPGACQMKCVIV